jgi:hypothetical protein
VTVEDFPAVTIISQEFGRVVYSKVSHFNYLSYYITGVANSVCIKTTDDSSRCKKPLETTEEIDSFNSLLLSNRQKYRNVKCDRF